MSTFVTFLGRGRENTKTGEWEYRKATYDFPHGEKTTAFFGIELARYLEPDRIVILGTNSSQWGVLVETLAGEGEKEDERIELMEAEKDGNINKTHLEKVKELIENSFEFKCKVIPRLIPFGKCEKTQYEILSIIAEAVEDGEVNFDLTHGFRHFGMIGFLSSFMLARVREKFEVENLWYGALDMTKDGITPVLQLDGLDRVRQWLEALNRFDATGNYRVFAELLKKDGADEDKTEHLKKAAFYERTLNLSDAVKEIKKFRPVLESKLSGASGLFQQRLAERLTWIDLDKPSKRQAELARQYLERRDYVRAALFGWESLFTQECEKNKLNPNLSENRKAVALLEAVQNWPLRDGQKAGDNREAAEYLKEIRHALAHGTPPKVEAVKKMIKEEAKLNDELKKIFDCLLPN